MTKIPTISGLKDIYQNYDVFILDQWGVMHDGYKGYSKAISCIKKLFVNKKQLSIISNSSKRKNLTILKLPKLGFKLEYFLEIMTSGEMIWQSLENEKHKETKNLGKNCFHIFDERKEDGNLFLADSNKFNIVDNIVKADFILGCTPFCSKKVVDYIPLLNLAKENKLPFICANPDFDTIDTVSNTLKFCMGTIAELYKNIGGKVFYLGKPNTEIYYEIIKKLSKTNKSRILAIGDSLHHDIKGAINFGIDSLLITSTGIHQNFFDKKNPKWTSDKNSLLKLGIEPTFICSYLNF